MMGLRKSKQHKTVCFTSAKGRDMSSLGRSKERGAVSQMTTGKCNDMSKVALCALVVLFAMPFSPDGQAAPTVNSRPTPDVTSMNVNPSDQDLMVAAFGTDVVITREYTDGQWHWNRRWANITANLGSDDGSWAIPLTPNWVSDTATIVRNDATYGRTSPGTASRFADLRFVAQGAGQYEFFEISANTLTWEDRDGNWIDYELKPGLPNTGVIREYGNQLYSHTLMTDNLGRVTEVIDHFDNSLITFSYLDNTNLPTRIEDYSGRSVSYLYNDQRQLTEIVDVRGKSWHYTYTQGTNSKPKIASITDPRGNTTKYHYTNNSITKTDADGLDTVYTYRYDRGTDKTIRTEETPDGTIRKIVRDNTDKFGSTPKSQTFINGELISQRFGDQDDYEIENQAGERTRYQKNAFGKLERVIHPDQTEESWEYSADGRYKTAYVDRTGVRTEWEYDSYGRVVELREAAGLPEQRTTRYSYPDAFTRVVTRLGDQYTPDVITTERDDQFGNTASYTDGETNTTDYTHNAQGKVLTETKPSGANFSYEYDPQGNLTKQTVPTDSVDRVTDYAYDAAGNLTEIIWPNEAVTTYGYNTLNERVSVTDELNQTTDTIYDRTTRTFTVKDARDAEATVRLDAHGRPVLIEGPNGNVTQQTYEQGQLASTQYPTFERTFDYGAGSRLKQVTDHYDGRQSSTQLQLNPFGELKEQVDDKQNPEYREYDGLGRLTLITDATGGTTHLTYDVHGNLVQVTDPETRSTWFEYNRNGQVVSEERRPEPGEVNRRIYEYDDDGSLHIEITPNGEKVVYDYNPPGELTNMVLYPDQSTSTPEKVVKLSYNDLGQLKSYDDGETSGSYNYDDVGQLLNATIDYGPFSKSISYTYDKAGNISTYTNPEEITYTYAHDANGQIESIEIPGLGLVSFTDYQWNQPRRIQLPGGSVIQRQYDGLQRMASNTLLDPAQQSLMNVVYGYDSVGNITSQSTEHGEYRYDYDSLYRLTDAEYPAAEDETFSYDGVGNRINYNGAAGWQYNDANQLTENNDTSYEYDANGHLVQKTENGKITRYFYNSQERLIRVENGSGNVVARYGFDPFGHRLWKMVDGVKVYFLYNRSGLVAEYDSSGLLVKEYQYVPKSPWMTSPLFQRDSGQIYFYQNNHLGAPSKMISAYGEMVWSVEYSVFGGANIGLQKQGNNLRFPGQYHDNEVGTYYNYHRDYDHRLGRYLQSDPIGLEGGINTYSYSQQNPVRYSDNTGLKCRRVKNEHGGYIEICDGTPDDESQWSDYNTGEYSAGLSDYTPPDTRTGDQVACDQCKFSCGMATLLAPGPMIPKSTKTLGQWAASFAGGAAFCAAVCKEKCKDC